MLLKRGDCITFWTSVSFRIWGSDTLTNTYNERRLDMQNKMRYRVQKGKAIKCTFIYLRHTTEALEST